MYWHTQTQLNGFWYIFKQMRGWCSITTQEEKKMQRYKIWVKKLVYYSSSSSSGEKAHKKDYLHKFSVSFSSCFLYLLQISSCCCKTCRTSNKNSPCIPTLVVVFTVDIVATFLCVCVLYRDILYFFLLYFLWKK